MKNSLKKIIKSLPLGRSKKVKVGNYELLANKDHSIEIFLNKYPHYSKNIARLAKAVTTKYLDFSIIDIGANIGDTVALIKSEVNVPIICFEGNDSFFELLKTNLKLFPEVKIYHKYLADKDGAKEMSADTNYGTSLLIESKQTSNEQILNFNTLDSFFNQLLIPSESKLLKIDTDGYDLKILRGAKNFLSNVKPILFFELDKKLSKEDEKPTLDYLIDLGYKYVLIYDNFGNLLLSMDLNINISKQLVNYSLIENAPILYYDIILFHRNDEDLNNNFITAEEEYFSKYRTK